ncbi:MAG: hypothetical protein QF654_13635 [Alphaproteobacteria bacterium]|nr:hypothetical protein [Alphaproteobacteria bacterium]
MTEDGALSGRNIASVCWVDHLMFGERDGRLATADALARRIESWRQELDVGALHWRPKNRGVEFEFTTADGGEHPVVARSQDAAFDEVELVPKLAHDAGLEAHLYVSLFDEGWPLAPPEVRAVSYHNDMHCQHVAWQTTFGCNHPEFMLADRSGENRQMGVVCLAYESARAHFRQRYLSLLRDSAFDGLFLCLRSQSRPADFADQFGFNEPVRQDYRRDVGRGIDEGEFDVQTWRDILGAYLTTFIEELRQDLRAAGYRLAVGAARGDILGPPLGNATLDWRGWIERSLVDQLVINQNSSRCPSMWHDLWPMHRGGGYLQNYLDGTGLADLTRHIHETYAPILEGHEAAIYVARQWDQRDATAEAELLAEPAVAGLVFSTFRHDNPDAVARGDWRA